MRRFVALFATISLVASALSAADFPNGAEQNWHQWRGPAATGTSLAGNPPVEWSPEKNIKWSTPIPGRGSSSPVIWGNRIFLLTAVDTGQAADAVTQSSPRAIEGGSPRYFVQAGEQPPGEQPEGERRRGRGRGGPGGGRGGFGRGGAKPNIHQFTVVCIDRTTGKPLWEKVAREAAPLESGHDTNTHASASATTDGQRLYCSFGSQGIFCYDLDGKPLWDVDLGDMQTRNGFGEGSSPTIYKDTLIVAWDHEAGSFIVALNAATGKEKWREPRDEVTTWNTPLVVEANGRTQVIVNGTNRSRSYDLATGEQIWECGGQATNPIASCVTHEGLVYCMTGHKGSAVVAIPLDAEGDITGTEKIAWQANQGAPYVPSPILADDRLYFLKSSNGILSCLDARTGEPIIDQKRVEGIENVYASLVGRPGKVYITSRDGTTVVIRDGDDVKEVEVLATNSVGEPVDASPAIVGDEIYIRGEKNLFCISAE